MIHAHNHPHHAVRMYRSRRGLVCQTTLRSLVQQVFQLKNLRDLYKMTGMLYLWIMFCVVGFVVGFFLGVFLEMTTVGVSSRVVCYKHIQIFGVSS